MIKYFKKIENGETIVSAFEDTGNPDIVKKHIAKGNTPISESEAQALTKRIIPEEEVLSQNRASEYPSIQEQLDLLYRDTEDGLLQKGKWFAAIKRVKDKYPKKVK